MFPFEKHFETTKRSIFLTPLLFIAVFCLSFFQANTTAAQTCEFNSKILSSDFPFENCPVGVDTIIIRDTFEINTNYEPFPGNGGLPFEGILRVEDGGVLYWSSPATLKLGINARILLYDSGHIYPGSPTDIGCNPFMKIFFDTEELANCSGGSLHNFSDVNQAGCFDGTGICCDATITVLEHSGYSNDNALCSPGDSVTLSVYGSGNLDYDFSWYPVIGPENGPYTVAQYQTTTYSVSITAIFDPYGPADPYLLTCGSSSKVTNNTTINLIANTTPVPCASSATGTVNLTVSGGTAPYKYIWSNDATTEDLNNLTAGTYTVTVTDSKGCTQIKTATVATVDNTPPTLACPANGSGVADPGLCTTTISSIDATFSDNCPSALLLYNISGATSASGTGQLSNSMAFESGTSNVTYTVDDGSNQVSCSFSVQVQDNQFPTATNPPTITGIQCYSGLPAVDTEVVTDEADNCGTPTVTFQSQSVIGGMGCPGNPMIVSRKYRVTDPSGNGITVTQFLHIADDTNPVFTNVPSNITVNCESIPGVGTAKAVDNCTEITQVTYLGETRTNGACSDSYTLTRSWKAQDDCGNSVTTAQVITVIDNIPPVFSSTPSDVTVSCDSIPAVGTPAASDNCDGAVSITFLGENIVPGACQDSYTLYRSWKAEDNCGNTNTTEQVITVRDTQKPTFTSVPANAVVSCDAIPPVSTPAASDNCDANVTITYLGETSAAGSCSSNYNLTRSWQAEDNCGNTNIATQTITVQDVTKPVFSSVPANVTVSCDAIPAAGNASATDNCDPNVSVIYNGETRTNGGCAYSYTITRTWTATDICGNSQTATQLISVEDNTAPVFTSTPADVTVSCDAIPNIDSPEATDNCASNVNITYGGEIREDGGCQYTYRLRRSWTAMDECGNASTTEQVIDVQDTTAPVFDVVPANITVSCDAIPAIGTALASDNCDPSVNVGFQGEHRFDGGCAQSYSLVREWMAMDACGNTTLASQTIVVEDNTAPVFTYVPPAVTASCESIPAVGNPTAADNCSGSPIITYLGETIPNAGGACPGNFTIIRSWEARDECGNASIATQELTVKDISEPVVLTVPADETVSCSAIPAVGTPTATDNCDADLTITFNGETRSGGSCANSYTLQRKWTIADDCGNTATAIQTLTVIDTTAPFFTMVPDDITVSCEDIPTVGDPEALDNCASAVSISYTGDLRIDGACPDTYKLLRSWSAQDSCGNIATTIQTITVRDQTPPVFISVPADETVSCDAVPAPAAPTATDNCAANVSIVYNGETRTDGNCPNSYTLSRSWTASDNCGNTSIVTQILTVQDVTPPSFTFIPPGITVECDAIPSDGLPIANDNCSSDVNIAYMGEVRTDGSCPGNYTLLRTWEASDECGNISTATQMLVVQDLTAPTVLSVPQDETVSCSDIPAVGAPVATDNCDPNPNIVYDGATRANGTCPNSYTLTRHWTISDNCGNTSTAIQTLTVEDVTPPVFTAMPSDVTVSCESVPAVGTPSATDNCSANVTISYDGAVRTDGACPDSYLLERKWIAVDSCGNASFASQFITVQDLTPPNFMSLPPDVTVSCDDIPPVFTPTAVDNCDAFVTISYSGQTRIDGNCTYSYILKRDWVATDNCGNATTAQQTITVQDIKPPVFTFVPAGTTVNCESIPGVDMPTATDNCDPDVTITYKGETRTDGTCPSNYSLLRTWSGVDDCGNETTVTQLIQVQDITAPSFSFVPADTTVNCDGLPAPGLPMATDNCDASPNIIFAGETIMSSTSPDSYTLERKWIASDACGNATVATQMLTVQDTVAPAIICPADIVLDADGSNCSAIVTFNAPVTSDNCSTILDVSSSATSGQAFPIGKTTVTMTVKDPSNNEASCTFTVTARDTTAPVLHNCPADLTFTTDPSSCETMVTWPDPSVTDPCDSYAIIPTSNIASGTIMPTGIETVVYTATDTTGNSSQCSFQLTVNELVPPVIVNCPQDIVLHTDTCSATATWIDPQATDNCAPPVLTVNIPSGSVFPETTTMVEYTATDVWGNTATCSFNVTVIDDVAPTFSGCPSDFSVDAGVCEIPVSWTQPVATDNCTADPIVFSVPAINDTFPSGFTTVHVYVQDPSGNQDTCTFVVEVIGPAIGLATLPADQSFVGCEAVATWNPPTPTGICGPFTLTSNYEPGDTFDIGVTEVIYTLEDTLNHTVTTSFTITVTELVPPQFDCPVSPIKVNTSGAVLQDISAFLMATDTTSTCDGVDLQFLYPIATDNCSDPIVTQMDGPLSAEVFNLGTHNLVFQAQDDAGNTTLCSVEVQVLPLLPVNPQVSDVIACDGDEVTISANVISGATYTWDGPDAPYPDNNNLLIPSLNEDLTGIYTVYATINGCKTPVDSALVRIGHLPVTADDLDYEVGTNETLANFNVLLNDTYELDDYTVTLSSPLDGLIDHGNGIFSFNAGPKNTTYSFFYTLCSKTCPDLCDIGTVSITARERICAFIPNIITPNGDGVNDFLIIPCLDMEPYPDNQLIIFNQWGQKVYEAAPYSNEPDKAWRGTLNGISGKDLPDAPYYYIFKATPEDSGLKGFVEIFR